MPKEERTSAFSGSMKDPTRHDAVLTLQAGATNPLEEISAEWQIVINEISQLPPDQGVLALRLINTIIQHFGVLTIGSTKDVIAFVEDLNWNELKT